MKRLLQLLILLHVAAMGSAQLTELSYIQTVQSTTKIQKTIKSKSKQFVWLLQVQENNNVPKDRKKAFVRVEHGGLSNSIVTKDKLYDQKDELTMIAYDEVNLQCAVFHNTTENHYFLHKWSKDGTKKYNQLNLSKLIDYRQTNVFMVSTSCLRICVDLRIFQISQVSFQTTLVQGNYIYQSRTCWNCGGRQILGTDRNIDFLVTAQLIVLKYQYQKNNAQFAFGYSFLTNIDLLDYRSQPEVRSYLDATPGQSEYIIRNTIIIGFNITNNIWKYKINLNSVRQSRDHSRNSWGIVFYEIYGDNFTQKPVIQTNQDLTILIVYGKTIDQKPFYEGYHINYSQKQTNPIKFPSAVTNYYNFLALGGKFLYVRNKNIPNTGKGNYSTYFFVEQMMVPYFQEQIITDIDLNTNWKHSFITETVGQANKEYKSAKMVIYHLFGPQNMFYFKKDQQQSFQELQTVRLKHTSEMTLTTLTGAIINSDLDLRLIMYDFKQTKTSIHAITYDPTIETTKKIELVTRLQGSHLHVVQSKRMGCVCTRNGETGLLKFHKIEYKQTGKIMEVGSHDFGLVGYPYGITIAQDCSKVKIGSNLYLMKGQTGIAKLELYEASSKWQNAKFDSTFKFAIVGDIIYNFNENNYEKIFDSSFFLQNEIISNEDGNKLVVTSVEKAGISKKIQIKVFYLQNKEWKNISITGHSKEFNGQMLGNTTVSTDFKRVGVCYQDQLKSSCLFIFIDYQKVTSYQILYPLTLRTYQIYLRLQTNLIYLSYLDQERILKEKNKQIQLLAVNLFQYIDAKRIRFVENQDGSFYTMYLWQAENSIHLFKTPDQTLQGLNQKKQLSEINPGFFMVENMPYKCRSGCKNCLNYEFCTECAPGYSLNDKTFKCVKCPQYGKICWYANLDDQTKCLQGFYFDQLLKKCQQCQVNCLVCQDRAQHKCNKCKFGFFLNTRQIQPNKKRICLDCPSNCDTCFNSTMCTVCQYGFSPSANGTCLKCSLDCIECNPQQIFQCTSCRLGFELVTLEGKKMCRKCPKYCQNCINEKCNACSKGYIFNSNSNVCYKLCQYPCRGCSDSSPNLCLSCIGGYQLNGTQCIENLSCNQKANCISCPSGYYLSGKKCFNCSLSKNCYQCTSSNPLECYACKKGYYLLDGKCEICQQQQCLQCIANNLCTKCKDGFFIPNNQIVQNCIPCASNCTTCTQSATNCETCASGFKLEGSVCNLNTTVSFWLRLNLEMQKFTNDIFNKIITEIAKISGKRQNTTRIRSVKKGSTIVQGSVDVTGTEDESSTLSTLSSALSQGSTIAGQEVVASQVTGFTQLKTAESETNIGLIIGIAVPVSVFIIGLIILIVYRCFFDVKVELVKQPSDKSVSQTQISEEKKRKRGANMKKSRKNGFMPRLKQQIYNKITFGTKHQLHSKETLQNAGTNKGVQNVGSAQNIN